MTDTGTPGVLVRSATVEDAGRLAVLRYRFRSELAQPIETDDAFVARAATWMADRLQRGTWRAWVAVDGAGQIVGHIFAQFVEKVPNPVPEAELIVYLTNIYVVPEARNRGIGGRLLATALEACREVDVDTIILWPSEQSVSLYRRHGFATPAGLLELPWGEGAHR